MKQSSIEWLVENLTMVYPRIQEMRLLVDKAKAMHRGEIEYANYNGQSLHAKYTTDRMMRENAEYYYNETFNTKEK